MQKKVNEKYIHRCFELAELGSGFVSPNPLVGAVIVKDNKIISEGYHKKYGESHAEAIAIRNSKETLTGATLYCNLEPCCHTNKKTPPCVPLIINCGISRVIISNTDPNPEVNGKGIEILKNAGIEVKTGVLEDEGKKLNKFYLKYTEKQIPFVTVKIAQSLDAKISITHSDQTWLTGAESRKYVHRLRAQHDAVLVGANTVNVDNPKLNVRFVEGRNPKRVIIDGNLNINTGATVLWESTSPGQNEQKNETWIVTSNTASIQKKKNIIQMGSKIIELTSTPEGKIDLMLIMKMLGEKKITSVLVEGGRQVFQQFIKNGLFDELIVLQSPRILGKGISAFERIYDTNHFNTIQIINLTLLETKCLGNDVALVYSGTK